MRSHDWIDQRSLALGRAVADRLRQRPELMDVARGNLRRWMTQNSTRTLPVLREWLDLLDGGDLAAVLGALTADTESARRLRQSSPFAGALTPAERWKVLREYEARAA
jgi:hypothetical protein